MTTKFCVCGWGGEGPCPCPHNKPLLYDWKPVEDLHMPKDFDEFREKAAERIVPYHRLQALAERQDDEIKRLSAQQAKTIEDLMDERDEERDETLLSWLLAKAEERAGRAERVAVRESTRAASATASAELSVWTTVRDALAEGATADGLRAVAEARYEIAAEKLRKAQAELRALS